MTERSAGSEADADGLLLTVLFRLGGADLDVFERYEAGVLPLLAKHGGTLERRVRSIDSSLELHVIRFSDREAFDRFRDDEHRVNLAPLLAQSRVTVEILEGRDVASDSVAAISPTMPDALDPKTTALVLIDVQIGFDDPVWGQRNNPSAEARIADLLATWRSVGSPVYHVQHASTEPFSTLRPDVPGHAIKPEAAPRRGEPLYVKQVNSGFIGTTLEVDLKAAGIETVVLVGISDQPLRVHHRAHGGEPRLQDDCRFGRDADVCANDPRWPPSLRGRSPCRRAQRSRWRVRNDRQHDRDRSGARCRYRPWLGHWRNAATSTAGPAARVRRRSVECGTDAASPSP